ncbi:MAG: ribosome hibernation-promoting factor, HPF/YfiA family [Gammaproteobacteria bacterium]
MQLNLSGHHVDVTPALKQYVASKLERLERHFDRVTLANVVLSVEKLNKKAEATVNISGGQLFADAMDPDMYAAIDALADKLDRQIRRHKEKISNHHRGENPARS